MSNTHMALAILDLALGMCGTVLARYNTGLARSLYTVASLSWYAAAMIQLGLIVK